MIRRILLVTYEYPPLGGGGGVFSRMLARQLAQRLEVTILTSHRKGLPREERRDGSRVVRVPVWGRSRDAVASLASLLTFPPSALRRGRDLLREGRFDIVHTSFAIPSGPAGAVLAKRARVPHVLSVHGGDLYDPSKWLSPHRAPLLRQTVRWLLRGADRVVVPSNDTRERVRGFCEGARITRIPLAVSGIDVPMEKGRDGDGEHRVVRLITVGRLIPRKGLGELIEVVGQLRDRPIQLLIVGEGPLRRSLEKQVAAARLDGIVSFTGFVDEAMKWRLLREADIYVSTTRHEAFGIALLEALHAGLPVVAYERGGQRDFCAPACSHLVALGDRQGLSRRLAELIASPGERRCMGEAARRVAGEYTPERLAERYLALYEELCSGNSR